jgi:predicted GNAT family acetyltransferase
MTERLRSQQKHVYEAVGSLSVMNAFTAPSCSLWEKSAETCFYEAVGSLSVKNAFTAPSCSLWEKAFMTERLPTAS